MFSTPTPKPNERFGTLGAMREVDFSWYMYSPGPGNSERRVPWPDHLLAAYNPSFSGYHPHERIYAASNGVISDGWIARSNKVIHP